MKKNSHEKLIYSTGHKVGHIYGLKSTFEFTGILSL